MFYLYDIPIAIGQGNLIIGETEGSATTSTPPPAPSGEADTAEPAPAGISGFLSNWGLTIVLYVAVIYYFLIRPQRKKKKATTELQSALKVGDSIVTISGMYGTIAAIGDECCVIEFGSGKSVKIPIKRSEIVGIKEPDITA